MASTTTPQGGASARAMLLMMIIDHHDTGKSNLWLPSRSTRKDVRTS